jgi:dephospho-CoA kinase
MDEQAASLRGKFIVGVTGNIATGKSVVTRLAAENGALTIDADKLVHEVMDSDVEMQAAIAVAFGPEVRRSDGRIERRVLGDIVFNDPDAMRDLEEMIHPPVYEETVRRLAESDRRLVFIEAIKLLEGNLAEICQQIWVTRCSKQRQLERLRICRGMNTPTAATPKPRLSLNGPGIDYLIGPGKCPKPSHLLRPGSRGRPGPGLSQKLSWPNNLRDKQRRRLPQWAGTRESRSRPSLT